MIDHYHENRSLHNDYPSDNLYPARMELVSKNWGYCRHKERRGTQQTGRVVGVVGVVGEKSRWRRSAGVVIMAKQTV